MRGHENFCKGQPPCDHLSPKQSLRLTVPVWLYIVIFNTGESFEDRFEDDLSSTGGNGHTNLLSNLLLRADELKFIWEGLKPGSLSVRQRSWFTPVIYVSPAPATPRNCVGRSIGYQPSVDLTQLGALNVQTEPFWYSFVPGVFAFRDEAQHLYDLWSVSRGFVIRGIAGDRR